MQTIPQSLKTADKAPLDGRYKFSTLEAASLEAYDGAIFYVADLKEWYKFKMNDQGVLVAFPDSAIDASKFALKSDLNGLATSVKASEANDGLMNAADFLKLSRIDASRITKVEGSFTNGNIKINGSEVAVYAHPSSPDLRHVTDTEKETWNGKAEKVHVHSNYAPLAHEHNDYAAKAHEHQVFDIALGRYREKYMLADSTGSGGNATSLGGLPLNNQATGEGGNDALWSASKVLETVNSKVNAVVTAMDWKQAVATFAHIATAYPNPSDGWTVTAKDTDVTWRFNGTVWVDISVGAIPNATPEVAGKMSQTDKAKLDGVEQGANRYIHPDKHLASAIEEEANKRFMTDAERSKLGGVAENANNYVHPGSHAAGMITEEINRRFMTDAERAKLSGIAENANSYAHPVKHPASMIDEESNKQFMTVDEKIKVREGFFLQDNFIDRVRFFDNPQGCYISISCSDGQIRFIKEDTNQVILTLETILS